MRPTADPTRHRCRLRGCSALASLATLTAAAAALATSSPPAQAAVSHPAATSPDATSSATYLSGVSAESATDTWAAGNYLNSSGAVMPFILQWAGGKWRQVASPAPSGAESAYLSGVSADSATDAWAAGQYTNSSGVGEPLLLHWAGTAWTPVASPALSGAQSASLRAVSADSATDAWAAGTYIGSSGAELPLLLHWNGTAWTQVTSPVPSGAEDAYLSGVSAVSATDAWAAGYYLNSSGVAVPLIQHWTGTAWKQVTTSAPSGATFTSLSGVSVKSATDAWAAGQSRSGAGISSVTVPFILHWAGSKWKQVASPAPSGAVYTILNGVSAVSSGNAWAVGGYKTTRAGALMPVIMHWNGTVWKQVTSPAPPTGAQDASLDGVSAGSSADTWAAGSYTTSSGTNETLTFHRNGTVWKKVTSPNGS